MSRETGAARTEPAQTRRTQTGRHRNDVRLVGRLGGDPQRVDLPSGDVLWTLRVVVDRPPDGGQAARRVDALECAVWSARLQRSVSGWRAGDLVAVEGSLRRRFYGRAGAKGSRVDVEVVRGRVMRRATT